MRTDDEMKIYLEEILEHSRTCDVENCGLCQSAQRIYRLVRNLVFSEVVYPDVTIAAHTRQVELPPDPPAAGAIPIRRAA